MFAFFKSTVLVLSLHVFFLPIPYVSIHICLYLVYLLLTIYSLIFRWEPNFDSVQLSQRFSWEFLDGATPFQLLNPLLAPLDACLPKTISIELVTTMPENVLKNNWCDRCGIASGSLVFSERGLCLKISTGTLWYS